MQYMSHPLKYLFTALLKDGRYLNQTQEDKSVNVEGRNAFFDILEETKRDNAPLMFCLAANFEGGSDYLVDLRNGEFVINGGRFFLHDPKSPLENFRLIYYKTRKEHFAMGQNIASETIFHLGWQANDKDGNNIQRIIDIY